MARMGGDFPRVIPGYVCAHSNLLKAHHVSDLLEP